MGLKTEPNGARSSLITMGLASVPNPGETIEVILTEASQYGNKDVLNNVEKIKHSIKIKGPRLILDCGFYEDSRARYMALYLSSDRSRLVRPAS